MSFEIVINWLLLRVKAFWASELTWWVKNLKNVWNNIQQIRNEKQYICNKFEAVIEVKLFGINEKTTDSNL